MGLFRGAEFWFTIAVLIFVAVLWKPAKKFLIGGLDARAERIREELAAASDLREEAERTLASLRVREREAATEAEQIVAHAKAEAERIAAESARAIEEALQRRQRLAEERIAQEEARAVAEIRAVTVDIAISAARRLIAAELDEQRGAALIDAAIAELPSQLH
ncbi:MAG TPA: F0F1 ATP synthase subunit B [Stellaceae bacterium]|jgi:F-type H+-transporting ATPase subunit b|nr:F0F1 ATP synthase subunit B [Stellaceae bacterium]